MSQHLDELIARMKEPNYNHAKYKALASEAIDELVRVVMEREPGIPTRGEAMLLFWLEKCKSNEFMERSLPDTTDESLIVRRSTTTGRETDSYPANPYLTPPFKAPVYMPDGRMEMWGPKKLRETGAMVSSKGEMPYDMRFGAELHYNPATNRVNSRPGPNWDQQAWLDFCRRY